MPLRGKVFMGPSAEAIAPVDHFGLEESFGLQVVHQIVGIVGSGVANRAFSLFHENLLPPQLGLGGLFRVQLAENVQLRRGREIQKSLKLGHEMHLAAALQDIEALFGADDRISVEIGRALLELGEVLHGFQGPLGSEQALDVHSRAKAGYPARAGISGA